jgi:UDP-N-acetylmuramate--alanine ligase
MRRIHLVGVSGIGMSALAGICIDLGYHVTGSADTQNEQTEALKRRGMTFFLGHAAPHVGSADTVVRSAAVPLENPEIQKALESSIPVLLYSEFLGILMGKKKGIAIAGTHGKTTTTALTGWILRYAGYDPTVVCGGVMRNTDSNAIYGKGEYFVAEACEYQRSFLNLKKWHSIVTNIENDHLDYYRDIRDINDAFSDFLRLSEEKGITVINGDDVNLREVVKNIKELVPCTVGYGEENRYRIQELVNRGGYYSFLLTDGKAPLVRLELSVPGRFNCVNAALSTVLAFKLGIAVTTIQEAARQFIGTGRRLEHLGRRGKQQLYTDYAHHPTEISLTLKTLMEIHADKKICVVFQPHQHSRTAKLFDGFVETLLGADSIILTNIYRQRDSEDQVKAVSSKDLLRELKKADAGKRVELVSDDTALYSALEEQVHEEMVVVFLGAGDIDGKARHYAALPAGWS